MLKDIAQGDGDLTARLKDTSGTETQELAEWFNKFVEQVHGIIREVSGNSKQVNQALNGAARPGHQPARRIQRHDRPSPPTWPPPPKK